MNIKEDFKVCGHCYGIFNQLLENLADSVSDVLLKQSVATQKIGKKSEEMVRGSMDDTRLNNKLLTKFFRHISDYLEHKRFAQLKDYLEVMLADEKDTLELKFKKMRRILDNGNLASSYRFDEIRQKKVGTKHQDDGPDDNFSTIHDLIMNLEDDSGILNEEPNDHLNRFESSKLMALANNKYNINFKDSYEFKSSRYLDNDRSTIQADKVDIETEIRPITSHRKTSDTKHTTESKLSNVQNFKREAKPRISKLNE